MVESLTYTTIPTLIGWRCYRLYILTYSDLLEEWILTNKHRTQNERKISYFSKKDGFQCTTDVINYIRKHFNLTLDQITCVNCYLTKDNNTDDHWGKCFWCNAVSHDNMIEYDDNGEPICPECRRAGAMVKL